MHKLSPVVRFHSRLVVVTLLLGLGKAWACADDTSNESARTAFDLGVKLVDEGNYSRALQAFRNANAVCPNFEVWFNIGLTQLKLEQWLDAFESLSRFLQEGQERVSSEDRIQVDALLKWLGTRLGELEVITQPSGALITVDGREVGRTPLSQPIRVMPGVHKVAASLEGHKPVERTVEIGPGKIREVVLVLPVDVVEPPQVRSRLRVALPYIVASAGVVLGGAALGVYLSKRDTYEQWQAGNAEMKKYGENSPDYGRLATENNRLVPSLTSANHTILGLTIGAGVLVAAGGALFIYDRRSASPTLAWGGGTLMAGWRCSW